MIIGYARVSTIGQTRAAQIQTLQAAGCTTLFQETAPGHRTHRVQLENALNTLSPGDTLIVTRLDRLARSSRDLHNIIARIETKRANLKAISPASAIIAAASVVSSGDPNGAENEVIHVRAEPDAA